jgi:hypothetical protein
VRGEERWRERKPKSESGLENNQQRSVSVRHGTENGDSMLTDRRPLTNPTLLQNTAGASINLYSIFPAGTRGPISGETEPTQKKCSTKRPSELAS